jgi:hypothetical protein
MHVGNEIKLSWYIHEFTVNWMTLRHLTEMATSFRKTRLNTTLHVVCLLPQNTVLILGNLQMDVSFQGLYVARFLPVHSVLQVAPKKEIWRYQVWQKKGQQSTACCSHSAVQQWPACWERAICWGCGRLLVHSTGKSRQCIWIKFHLLLIICSQITGKNDPGVVYESLYIIHSLKTIIISQQ